MINRSLVRAISAVAFAGLAVSVASADTLFNIDQNNGASPTQTGAAVIGSPGDLWNAISTAGVSTPVALQDSTGSTTGMLTFAASSSQGGSTFTNTGGTAMDTATTSLMEDYEYGAGGGGNLTQTISGLSGFTGSTFTLYVYDAGDTNGQGSTITLGGTGISNTGASASTTAASRRLSAGVGVAYQVFTGTITGNSFTITEAKTTGASNGIFNGLQLDIAAPVPELGTCAMVFGGLAILFALTRFRRVAA